MGEMFDLMRRYQIALPAAMAMLLKVLVMLEGTAQLLHPCFSLMEVLQPYQRKMLARRLSPARQYRKARRIVSEVEQLAEVVPRRLRDMLQQMQSGRFDVHLDHRGLEPSVNRLVLGMLTSALFLGSTLMVTRNVWPVHGVSVPGALGGAEHGLGFETPAGDQQIGPPRSEEINLEASQHAERFSQTELAGVLKNTPVR